MLRLAGVLTLSDEALRLQWDFSNHGHGGIGLEFYWVDVVAGTGSGMSSRAQGLV